MGEAVFHTARLALGLLAGLTFCAALQAQELSPSAVPPIMIPAPIDSAPEHASTPFVVSPDMLARPFDGAPGGMMAVKRLSLIGVRQLTGPMRAELEQRLRSAEPARAAVPDDDAGWPRVGAALSSSPGTQGLLHIEPRPLDGSGFARMRLLGWVADDARPGETIASVERHFRRDEGVLVVLHEWNYSFGEAAIFMVREMLNAEVGGHPAALSIETAPSGRVRTVLNWQDQRTDYRIVVLDDVDRQPSSGPRHDRQWLLDLANSLGT